MDTALRLLSIVSLPFTGFIFFLLARRIGRLQPARTKTYILGMVMPCLMMGVNMVFMLSSFIACCPAVFIPFIVAGFGFGYFWGGRSQLYLQGSRVMIRQTKIHLVFWLLAYTLTHLLASILPSSIAAAGLATMFFSTASAVGLNLNYLLRQKKLAQQPAAISAV